MKKIAVFVSGGGTDLQSIIDYRDAGKLGGEIAVVIGSKPGIYALERAQRADIETLIFQKKDYGTLNDMFEVIIEELKKREIDLIVLAGYLSILTPNIVEEYKKRIINIHPSLIPKYCGDGMYGKRVHEAVIKNGEKVSGCTVHYVDEGTDTGEIIAQREVPVYEDDTAESLAARVLTEEHKLLPETVAKILKSI